MEGKKKICRKGEKDKKKKGRTKNDLRIVSLGLGEK